MSLFLLFQKISPPNFSYHSLETNQKRSSYNRKHHNGAELLLNFFFFKTPLYYLNDHVSGSPFAVESCIKSEGKEVELAERPRAGIAVEGVWTLDSYIFRWNVRSLCEHLLQLWVGLGLQIQGFCEEQNRQIYGKWLK